MLTNNIMKAYKPRHWRVAAQIVVHHSMDAVLAILLAVFLHMSECHTRYENTIWIHSDSKGCDGVNLTNSTNVRWNEIDQVNLNDSTDVRFCQNEILITKQWIIRNLTKIKLEGDVTLKCQGKAGLEFVAITNLTIHKVKLVNCGFKSQLTNEHASVFIIACFHIDISNIYILNTTGAGLYVKNARGEVEIYNSHFRHDTTLSTDHDQLNNNTGVYLEMSGEECNATLNLVGCHFECDVRTYELRRSLGFIEANQGSGLKVVLGTRATHNSILIRDSVFRNLSAHQIGGMDVMISSNATNNSVSINNTIFQNNTCSRCGGGALRVNIIDSQESYGTKPRENNIIIANSSFVNNMAEYGGAVLLNTSERPNAFQNGMNVIKFLHCNFTTNGARYGSAVDAIASNKDSKFVSETTFQNCRFKGNFIREIIKNTTTIFGQGTVSLIHFSARFKGKAVFIKNIGTPLYLSSSSVEFSTDSSATFLHNVGLNGGAVALLGSSTLSAGNASMLNFTENEAYFKGGAIYFNTIDGHDYLTNERCFIQFPNGDKECKPKYFFMNNTAGSQFNKDDSLGKSIYASTLLPCNKQCGHYKNSSVYVADKETTFDCVGKFEYKENRDYEVATSAWIIAVLEEFNASTDLETIPGKKVVLPIVTRDEFNKSLDTVYKATVWKNQSTDTESTVDTPYRYTHTSTVVILGNPSNMSLNLTLTTEHDREIRVKVRIVILPCPPGYILEEHRCQCSADLEVEKRYQGISRCNATSFRALLRRGYWIGYLNESNRSLISSISPYGFCNVSNNQTENLLPERFNLTELDLLVCGESRTGRLCGKCRHNMSVYYHSSTYRCGSNRLCSIGWLLYGLSELLPVTLIFLTIIAFNIQLTAGSVNGLILYYQLSYSLAITANDFVKFPKLADNLYHGHIFLSSMFDLQNFFLAEKLSFCLWQGATTLDVISFKYVTVAYSLILVILTVCIIKICGHRLSCRKIRRVKNKRQTISNSVIHGISGFFVLCYSQCTTVSLLLLRPVTYSGTSKNYVLYDGSMPYLGISHLPYALPAFFFAVTLVTVPPAALLCYPMCYRIFHLLRIEETKFAKIICQLVPLEKFKPFFDSFQGSFKDKHRYTSGLYFVYRLILVSLAVFTTPNSNLFYILLEIQLLAMIFVHACFQPYKKSKHNRQDLFLFMNLAIINALTILNFKRSTQNTDTRSVDIIAYVQTLLLNLPTLYIAIKIGFFLFAVIRAHRQKKQNSATTDIELITERDEDDDDISFVNSNTYSKINESGTLSSI